MLYDLDTRNDCVLFLLLWNMALGKVKDCGRTMVPFSKISKWYALASLCGGPLAIFGSYMVMGFIGPVLQPSHRYSILR